MILPAKFSGRVKELKFEKFEKTYSHKNVVQILLPFYVQNLHSFKINF